MLPPHLFVTASVIIAKKSGLLEEQRNKQSDFWLILFTVTSVSFLLFSFFIKLIGGKDGSLFRKIGLVALALAFLALLNHLQKRALSKKKNQHEQQDDSSFFDE